MNTGALDSLLIYVNLNNLLEPGPKAQFSKKNCICFPTSAQQSNNRGIVAGSSLKE